MLSSKVTEAPRAQAGKPTMRMGDLCERLGYSVTVDFLAELGFEATVDRGARLLHEHDFPAICHAIAAHTLARASSAASATPVSGAIRTGELLLPPPTLPVRAPFSLRSFLKRRKA